MAQCLLNRRYLGPIAGPGEQEFLESALFQVPMGIKRIEVFLVGGGGGGTYGYVNIATFSSEEWSEEHDGGAAGGGGYIFHGFLDVTPKEILSIEIGPGGYGAGTVAVASSDGQSIARRISEDAGAGSPTTIKRNGNIIAQANGGDGGLSYASDGTSRNNGGNGESGGGAGNRRRSAESEVSTTEWTSRNAPTQGGSNGDNGDTVTVYYDRTRKDTGKQTHDVDSYISGGLGTGLCTHLWRDPNEPETFSGGGCGGEYDGSNPAIGQDGGGDSSQPGQPNTGGGGGGSEGQAFDYEELNRMNEILQEFRTLFQGGCGYAIIRWGFEE